MCDQVMRLLMEQLGLAVAPFKLKRRLQVSLQPAVGAASQRSLLVQGVDNDGTPYSLFSKVTVRIGGADSLVRTQEPFIVGRGDNRLLGSFRSS